eukprot:COSAG02_NODE_7261_length_3092_cov_5.086201_2_plen_72_part_00
MTRLSCSRFIQLDGGAGLREQRGGRRSLGTLSFCEAGGPAGRRLLEARGRGGLPGLGREGRHGGERVVGGE